MTQPRGYALRAVGLFCLGWALVYANRSTLFPMLKPIGEEFGLSGVQTGAVASAYFFTYVALQIPLGQLIDRLGVKRVLVTTYALAGLAVLSVGLFARSYPLLMALVALHGAGAAAYYAAAYSASFAAVPEKYRGLSAAVINSGMAIGLVLGLSAAGPIFHRAGTWRAPFLFLALPTLLVALAFRLFVHDVRPVRPPRVPVLDLLRDRQLLAVNLSGFCSLYGFWVVMTWGPAYFQTERGLPLEAAGYLTAVVAAASIPGALIFASLSDRLGRRRLSVLMMPLAAVAVGSMVVAPGTGWLAAALVAYGALGKLAWDPIGASWIGDHVGRTRPEAMGAALGLFTVFAMGSSVVAPLVSGWLRDLTGSLAWAFVLGATVVLAGAAFAAVAGETRAEPGAERSIAQAQQEGYVATTGRSARRLRRALRRP
ncbi:MAG: MFS transporter [Armatimonadetes bacterium]|nr:MFS transporter [Armatimonadota bacterium]